MIYFNNAATSYPKPDIVIHDILQNLKKPPCSLYRENASEDSEVITCRNLIAKLFQFRSPQRVVICSGATEALNIAIHGLVKDNGHVITTQIEHNSVLRPLYHLRNSGRIKLDIIPCKLPGNILFEEFTHAFRSETCLVVLNHVSNVTGSVQNIEEIYEVCKSHEIPLIVDVSQSAGVIDINFSKMPKAVLAFTGHKSLLGPRGTGGLLIGEEIDLKIWKTGGTGVRSDIETMPDLIPLKYEPGTMNHPGISGLASAISYIMEHGVENSARKRIDLTGLLYDGLNELSGVKIYSETPQKNYCGVLSFTMGRISIREIGYILRESFDIILRVGLHCAPLIHKTLGTFPEGSIRVSFSVFNTHDEVKEFLKALRIIKDMC